MTSTSNNTRNSNQNGSLPLLGGFTSLNEDKYRRNRKTSNIYLNGGLERFKDLSLMFRLIKILIGLIILMSILFFYFYQVHIEIQFFDRGWIKQTILPTPPLSSTCFLPSTIQSSNYNLSLAHSPKYVELHPGMGLPLGDDCYNFASTIPTGLIDGMEIPKTTIFHTYWRADLLPLSTRQIALFHSILSTQDEESTSLILWTNSDSIPLLHESKDLLNPLLDLYGSRFTIRKIDKVSLAKGTAMEGDKLLMMADEKAWLDGDLVRLLVLWKEGGIWVDMDTIMTGRDMRVLTEHEWVTQWDCYDKIYQPLNGAMMHFFKESPYLCEMLYSMSNDPPPREGTTDWGSLLYHKIFRRLLDNSIPPFKILPYCFTDGTSCKLDNRLPDPFGGKDWNWGRGKMEALELKVKSVFAVHLHNRWDKTFPTDGWVNHLILKKVGEEVVRYKEEKLANEGGKLDS